MIGTIAVGHAQDPEAATGCTVFLPPPGSVTACEVRGGAPGTRETELMRPLFSVEGANAILLSGGSAFGLDAAHGVTRYLEERGLGLPTPGGPVPVVSTAVIFDIDYGGVGARPDAEWAYRACVEAVADDDRQGCVGVGAGASVGNAAGRDRSTKSGFGLYRFHADGFKLEVAAVCNAFGEVVGQDGAILAGVRGEEGSFLSAEKAVCQAAGLEGCAGTNTTLVVVATDAALDKPMAARLALQGHNGLARAIRPSHTRYDGDTVFVIATGTASASQDALEALAAIGTAEAIRSGVMHATGAAGLPAVCDILGK